MYMYNPPQKKKKIVKEWQIMMLGKHVVSVTLYRGLQ